MIIKIQATEFTEPTERMAAYYTPSVHQKSESICCFLGVLDVLGGKMPFTKC